jgi:ABC-type bacteriocin/lantibiotic exporter with double-glycine peptidase domain
MTMVIVFVIIVLGMVLLDAVVLSMAMVSIAPGIRVKAAVRRLVRAGSCHAEENNSRTVEAGRR